MRLRPGVLAGLAVALLVPSAAASPRVPARTAAPPNVNGNWTGNGFVAQDELVLSSNGTTVSAGSTKNWVCDTGGWRPYNDGESVPSFRGPFKGLFDGSWTGDRTFSASYRYCYTGVFNANLLGVQPPLSTPGDLQATLSADGNTIAYTYKVPVPCNATDFTFCPVSGSGTLTRLVDDRADLGVSIAGPNVLRDDAFATYTVRLENKGPQNATGVTASVEFPPKRVLLGRVASTQGSCTKTASSVTCSFATVKTTEHPEFDLAVRRDGKDAAPIAMTVTIATATKDPVPANNKATRTLLTAAAPDVSIEIHGPEIVNWQRTPADLLHHYFSIGSPKYFVYVTNHGPGTVHGVYLTVSWFDGHERPITIPYIAQQTYTGSNAFRTCEPDVGQAHRVTCRMPWLDNGETTALPLKLYPGGEKIVGPLAESEAEMRALVKSGRLVVRADVKVKESERDGPFAKDKNNRAEKASKFLRVK